MLSEFIANFPVNVIFTAIFAIVLYFMANMRMENLAANLFIFIAENVLIQLATVGSALLAASAQVSLPHYMC